MQEGKKWLLGLAHVISRIFLVCFSVYALVWLWIAVGTVKPVPLFDFPLISAFGLVKFGEDVLIDYMEKHGSVPEDSSWSNYYQAISDLGGAGREKRVSTLDLKEKYITTMTVEYHPASDYIDITYTRKTKSKVVVNTGHRKINAPISEYGDRTHFIRDFKNSFYYIEKCGEYMYFGMAIDFGKYNSQSSFLKRLNKRVSRKAGYGEFLFASYRMMIPNVDARHMLEARYMVTISRKVKIPAEILEGASLP